MRPRTLPSRRSLPEEKKGKKIFTVLGAGVLLLGIVVIAGKVWFLQPRTVVCRTTENTTCPEQVEHSLQSLRHTNWWQQSAAWTELQRSLKASEADIVEVQFRRTMTLQVIVTLERATPLFAVQWSGQWWLLRSNGTLTPTDLVPPVAVVLSDSIVQDHALTSEWRTAEHLSALQTLFTGATHLSPALKRMELISPQEVRAQTDRGETIFLQVPSTSEVQRQLDTLQSLFRSSTMDTETSGRTIDVRFRDVIVK